MIEVEEYEKRIEADELRVQILNHNMLSEEGVWEVLMDDSKVSSNSK